MSTNQQVIDKALSALGVIESSDSANATDSADALTDLNNMMAAWRVSSKDLNWFSQDDLTATIPIPDWAEDAVIMNLAVKCSTTFRSPVTPDVGRQAAEGANLVTRTLINLNLEQADMSHLPTGQDRYNRANINTDT